MESQECPEHPQGGGRRIVPPPSTRRAHTPQCPFFWLVYLGLLLLFLSVLNDIASSPLAYAQPVPGTVHLKGAPSTPNTIDPRAGSRSLTHPAHQSASKPGTPHTPVPIPHSFQVPMKPGTLALSATQATHFLGSDKRLELLIPAGAITAQDLTDAGGKITLHMTQVAPASGSNAGGQISLGIYLLQLVDAHGVLTHGLRQPVTVRYHFQKHELGLRLDQAHFLLNGALSEQAVHAPGAVSPATGKTLASTLGTRQVQASHLDPKAQTLSVTPLISTPSTSLSWNSDAPIASFGKPNPFSTDLSAGGLTSSQDLAVPAGPGGQTPPVKLTYSSESVNGQHSYSSAAGWVGEGWNLSLGAVTWNQHNVVAGCTPQPDCGTNWQNQWFLNDPFGTGSELIPPDITISTFYDASSSVYCALPSPTHPCPVRWHTATESHAMIYSYIGPVTIPNQSIHPPCWRVWLPNGIMEEFGCTLDSLQYFYVVGGHAEVTAWNLDLIADPQGNQIHLSYQRDMENWTDPSSGTTYSYPRDVELQTIAYDSPACHDAQNMCSGASWTPLMQVVFNASHGPALRTGATPSGCNSGSNLRCDDPLDLSGSGGTAAPLIQNTFSAQKRPGAGAHHGDGQLEHAAHLPTGL